MNFCMTHSRNIDAMVRIGFIYFLVLPFLVLLVGCNSENAGDALSATERMRQRLDPAVGEYMARSELAFREGNYNLALAFTDSAQVLAPELADVPFMRGRILSRINQIDAAQENFVQTLQLDPEYAGARYSMALNAFRGGYLREAIDLYQEEAEITQTAGLFLELGKAYAKLGEADSARMAYERAIVEDSLNASVHMWYGQLLEETGDLEAALARSMKGLEIDPANLDYQYIIGTQYFRLGNNAEAQKYLRNVADQLPWHQGAQYNLGQVLMRQGESDRAAFYLARADSAQQLQQAQNEAQDRIDREPSNRDHWIELANIRMSTGDMEGALDAYSVALSIDPLNMSLQVNYANLLMASGQPEMAIRKYTAITNIDPSMIGAWLNLGAALANEGNLNAAKSAWEKALEYDPGNPQAEAYLKQLDEMGG